VETLWLSKTPVVDIGPLALVSSLVSLTLEDTKVSDISPLKGHPLKRLHIGRTDVTDLTPLKWMRLTRLIFTPARITSGLDLARNMPGLEEIGVDFPSRMLPGKFWKLYDEGEIK
jgi:Leucine-rich repeat (LRR) protein